MDDAVAQTQALIEERLDFPPADFGLADNDIDVVFLKALEPATQLGRSQIHQLAVDACPPIAQLSGAGDHFFVKTFAPAHDRTQNHDFLAAIRAADAIENLAAGQRLNTPAALHTVLRAYF